MAPTDTDLRALARRALAPLATEAQATEPHDGWDEAVLSLDAAALADDLAGVAERAVADTASGGTTGHATRPGHAEPWPDHLALDAGDADDIAALVAPIDVGLLIPAFLLTEHGWRLDGAQLIERGEPTWAVNGTAEVDPVAVLATTEALSRARQLGPTDDDSALTIGATIAPAVRARSGVLVVG